MNTILLTVDSLRADYVGFTDSDVEVHTPTLDTLATESLVFENAFSNAPYTRGSFPSILTGTYPWMYGGYESISDERPSLAATFSENGYRTGGFHSNPYLGAEFNYDRGFERYYSMSKQTSLLSKLRQFFSNNVSHDSTLYKVAQWVYSNFERKSGIEMGTPYIPAEELNDEVFDWLRSSTQPIFLWIHYMDAHHPYIPHDGTVSGRIDKQRAIRLRQKMIDKSAELTDGEVSELIRLYKGEIEYLDTCINNLLSVVEAELNMEDTLLCFLADHGEAFGEWGYFGHPGELHDELVHIPFLIKGPNLPSSTVDTPVSAIDTMPILLEQANLDVPGQSKGDTLATIHSSNDRNVFAHSGGREDGKAMVANTQWKMIRNIKNEEDKFFRRVDGAETEVVVSEHPEISTQLEQTLETHLEEIDALSKGDIANYEVTRSVAERLERLGYKE